MGTRQPGQRPRELERALIVVLCMRQHGVVLYSVQNDLSWSRDNGMVCSLIQTGRQEEQGLNWAAKKALEHGYRWLMIYGGDTGAAARRTSPMEHLIKTMRATGAAAATAVYRLGGDSASQFRPGERYWPTEILQVDCMALDVAQCAPLAMPWFCSYVDETHTQSTTPAARFNDLLTEAGLWAAADATFAAVAYRDIPMMMPPKGIDHGDK